ncbi:MAG: T9SS type A sorting domain-containing protein [candidate division WOR-3 bacterium]
MSGVIAMAIGLWPRVDVAPIAPQEIRVPLSWAPVGPEGGAVLSVYTFGTGDTVVAVVWPSIWLSPNQGTSWTQTAPYALFGAEDGTITADRSILMAYEGGIILRSTDWGATWDTVFDDSYVARKILSQEKLSTVYAAVLDDYFNATVFYRSTDNGLIWYWRDTVHYYPEQYALAAAPSNPNILFYACGDTDSVFIYRSTNGGGAGWSRVLARGPGYPDVRALAVHPINPNLVFASLSLNAFPPSGVLIVSTDMGGTWATADSGKLYTHLNFYQDTLLLASSAIPEGIKRFNLVNPSDTQWIYNSECVMWTDDASNILYGGTNGVGVIRSLTGGVSWDERNNGLYGVWNATPHGITAQGNTVYIADYMSGRVYKSTNGGVSWTRNQLNPVFDPSRGFSFSGLSIHAATENLVYAGIPSLATFAVFYRTTDGGSSWTPVSLLTAPMMFCLADRAQDTIYGLGWSLLTAQTGVFKSIDRGNSWNLVRPYPLEFRGLNVLGDVKVSSWGHIFMTDSAGVSRSTNGGASWAQMSPNLEMAWWMDTTGSAVFFTSSDTSLQGIWSWNNISWQWFFYGGDDYAPVPLLPDVAAEDNYRIATCWTTLAMGLAAVVAYDTFPYPGWNYDTLFGLIPSSLTLTQSSILLGTLGNGYFRAALAGVSTNEAEPGRKGMDAWVSGNKLFLNLPETRHVSIRIYDVSGRMVKDAFKGELPRGQSTLDLPKTMATGVYMVKLDAGTRVVLKWINSGR